MCLYLPLLFALSVLLTPPPPRSTLFPYTTLFRSQHHAAGRRDAGAADHLPHHHSGRHPGRSARAAEGKRSEEHTSELQSLTNLVCRLLLEKKNITKGGEACCLTR